MALIRSEKEQYLINYLRRFQSHNFGHRDIIFSTYVESDLRKMKTKTFLGKI